MFSNIRSFIFKVIYLFPLVASFIFFKSFSLSDLMIGFKTADIFTAKQIVFGEREKGEKSQLFSVNTVVNQLRQVRMTPFQLGPNLFRMQIKQRSMCLGN